MKKPGFEDSGHTTRLSVLFAGSPAIALPSLEMIAEGAKAGRWNLAGVLTNPDSARGRSGAAEPTEVGRRSALLQKEFSALGITPPAVLKFETLKTEAREAVSALNANLLVSFAYGKIFGPKFLALFSLGGINIHPSLLPKYRGASPIQEAIFNRDSETGICVQRLDAEMDAGNILAREVIPLNGRETTASLSEIAANRGAALLAEVLGRFKEGNVPEGIPQEGEPSYCVLLEKKSGLIDWTRSAPEIDAQIRSCNPWPLAYAIHNGQTLNILEAASYLPAVEECNAAMFSAAGDCPGCILGIDKKCGILVKTGGGILALTRLQYQNRKALPWQAFLNGARDFIGSRFSEDC
jgi:methionyl-tRNA formyltransferase